VEESDYNVVFSETVCGPAVYDSFRGQEYWEIPVTGSVVDVQDYEPPNGDEALCGSTEVEVQTQPEAHP
jgi:hypothetical protein